MRQCTLVLDAHHRCRNQGGHDLTSCSTGSLPDGQLDYACGERKPYVRFCHIPGLNGDSNEPHFKFSDYSYFTADTAHKTCANVGGKVPDLTTIYDTIWLIKSIEYLSSFVRFGWPYSLRWASWPVSYKLDRYNFKPFTRLNFYTPPIMIENMIMNIYYFLVCVAEW